MFKDVINSFAYTDYRGAFATRGIRDGVRRVPFSVGTQEPSPGYYITKDDENNDVTVTVRDGIATFSFPQTHPLVGIGDIVDTGAQFFYLNDKISPEKWHVTRGDGYAPADITDPQIVITIDKVFPSLQQAIDGTSSGARVKLATDDLTSINSILQIVVYDTGTPEDVGVGTITIDGWTTSRDNYIQIFTPYDIKSQCNSKLRHCGDYVSGGYSLTKDSSNQPIISIVTPYTIFDGLAMDGVAQGEIINVSGEYCQITNNVMKNAFKGIVVNADHTLSRSNIIYDMTDYGIYDSSAQSISINDTIVNCGVGIKSNTSGVAGWIINDLIQGGTTCIENPYNANLFNSITSDASSAGGTDCATEIVIFEDAASKIYRIDYRSGGAIDEGLGSKILYEEDLLDFGTDICGNKIERDYRFYVGASSFIPEAVFAAGYGNTVDRKSNSPYVTITDGEMTFWTDVYATAEEPQTDFRLCVGFKVTLVGGAAYFLYKKITSSKWQVTDLSASCPGDLTLVTEVDYIKAPFASLYQALTDDSGTTGVFTYLGSNDLVTLNRRVTIACANGTMDGCNVLSSEYTVDNGRYIKIFSPSNESTECNLRRKHSGYFKKQNGDDNSPSLPTIYGYMNTLHGINCDVSYTKIKDLQITASGAGIRLFGGKDYEITGNVLSKFGQEGIILESDVESERCVIANNVVIDAARAGIDIRDNVGTKTYGTFGTPLSNDWSLTAIDRSPLPNNFMISVEIGAVAAGEIIWGANSLKIMTTAGGKTTQEIFDSAVVRGAPWAEFAPISAIANIAVMSPVMFNTADNFVAGKFADTDSKIAIYNNTVRRCEYGIKIETRPDHPRSNDIRLINNLVEDSAVEDYFSCRGSDQKIYAESNYSSDLSVTRVRGNRNVPFWRTEFINRLYGDLRITFFSHFNMATAADLGADVFYQLTEDNVEATRSSYKWNSGANSWKVPDAAERELHFSVGSDSSNLDDDPARTITIESGILTFHGLGLNANIGVGDKVEYATGACYLAERGNEFNWYVVNNVGAIPADVTDEAVTSIKRVSNSLNAAIDGAGANGINNEIGFGSPRDLVANTCGINVWFYNDGDSADAGNVTIQGWTTSLDYRLLVQTPWNTNRHCPNRQRHVGYWAGGGGRIGATGATCVVVDNEYTILSGFRIKPLDDTRDGVVISDNKIGAGSTHNIVKDASMGIDGGTQANYSIVAFNIVYDVANGISSAGGKIYNNTVLRAEFFGIESSDKNAVNNIVQDCGLGYSGTGTPISCIDSGTSLSTAQGSYENLFLTFADKAADDFRIVRTDLLALAGTEIPTIDFYSADRGLPNINYDIEGKEIENRMIGASSLLNSEFETIDLYFSASMNSGDFKTGASPDISIESGIAEFSVAQTNANMGIGDKVDYDVDNKICYLYGKLSSTSWEVRDKFGNNPLDTEGFKNLNSIKHTFNELADAFSSGLPLLLGDVNNPFRNLSNVRYRINIPVYKSSSSHSSKIEIEFVCDEDNYIRVYTPYDIVNECNTTQRHLGWYDGASEEAIINPSPGVTDAVLLSTKGILFEGMILNANSNHGITIQEAYSAKIIGNIIFGANACVKTNRIDRFFDNFANGVKNPFWHSDFQDPNWPLQMSGDGKYNAVGANGWKKLTANTVPAQLSGKFDLEVGIKSDSNFISGINTTVRLGVTAIGTAASSANSLIVGWGIGELLMDRPGLTPTVLPVAPAIDGRVYRLRMVRGGTLSSSGVFTVGGPVDAVHFYWLDDFVGGSGTNSNQWQEFVDSPYTFASNFYLSVEGATYAGISYLKFWCDSGLTLTPYPSQESSVIANNVAYSGDNGVETAQNDFVYNNTVCEMTGMGIYTEYGDDETPDTLRNNVCGTCLISAFSTELGNAYNNISDDSSLTDENGNKGNQYLDFEDAPNFNFHPSGADIVMRAYAIPLRGDATYPFNIDAKARDRERLWDVGALEHVQAREVCYAVGKYYEDISTRGIGRLYYSLSQSYEKSIVTFSVPQTGQRFGIGNELIDLGNPFPNGCLLLEKIDTSTYVVTDYYGDPVSGTRNNYVVSSIVRPFNELYEAFIDGIGIFSDNYMGGTDLVAMSARVKIACYDDHSTAHGQFPALIPSLVTDADCFLRIFTPADTLKEVNVSQRHDGDISSGYFMDSDYPEPGISAPYCDYLEIIGLAIKASTGILIGYCLNYFIYQNIISECSANGIEVLTYEASKDVIANNLIYNCYGDAILCGSYSEHTSSELYIYNNTMVGCRRGVYFRKPDSWDTSICTLIGNISQSSRVIDYVEDYPSKSGRFLLYANISGDDSSWRYGGYRNYKDCYLTFVDRVLDKYRLNRFYDESAIDDANDLSNDMHFPFNVDIVSLGRETGHWDIGAFEVVDIIGSADLMFSPVQIMAQSSLVTDVIPTTIIYLREAYTAHVGDGEWFPSIAEINTYLLDNASYLNAHNIQIYVEGNKSFTGTFSLQQRDGRSVFIDTDPEEDHLGPATIKYDGYLIDDASLQDLVKFTGLKIHTDVDLGYEDYLISDTANTTHISFVNSIIQLNKDSVVGAAQCIMSVLNSILLYRNDDSASDLYLVKNSLTGNSIANSAILSYFGTGLTFATTNVASDDVAQYNLLYNYGDGSMSIGNTNSYGSIVDINPMIYEVELPYQDFNIEEVMVEKFLPIISSPMVDAGGNDFVQDLLIDIIGNSRIFNNQTVDIGPYELRCHKIYFSSERITKIFQDKLALDYSTKYYGSSMKEILYRDLYDQFIDKADYRDEFVRDSKVVIVLREETEEYSVSTDKIDDLVYTFEAYYDYSTMSIILTKNKYIFGDLFNNIFNDDRYVLFFDESKHTLSIYTNKIYDKALSGNRNVISNVKFGGPSIMNK